MTSSSTLRLVHQGGPLAAAAVAVGFGCSDVGSKKNAVLLHSPSLAEAGPVRVRLSNEDPGGGREVRSWGCRQGLSTSGAGPSNHIGIESASQGLRGPALNGATGHLQHSLPLWQNRLPSFHDLKPGPITLPFPSRPVLSFASGSAESHAPRPAVEPWISDQRRVVSHQEASTSGSLPGLAPGSGSQSPIFSFHSWHVPDPGSFSAADGGVPSAGSPPKPPLVVVLLGWLGSKQKHLKKYADWYTQQGIHCVTFTIPMASVLSVGKGGRAEAHIDELVEEIKHWVVEINAGAGAGEEHALMFHTFSNTGWLMYGAVLEKLHKEGSPLLTKIRGCVVDSAPVVDPDPQVWASGFAAALLGKRSSAVRYDDPAPRKLPEQPAEAPEPLPRPQAPANLREAFLHSALEKFFSVFLQLPIIRKRLAEVTTVLAEKQPASPQLYIYSSADKVIPAHYVETFIEAQKQQGRSVTAKNMEHSPHVDHFRANPAVYTQHLRDFLNKCVPHVAAAGHAGRGQGTPVAEA